MPVSHASGTLLTTSGGLLRRWADDVKGWGTGILIRYAIAFALLLCATAGVIGAVPLGLALLFHWIAAPART